MLSDYPTIDVNGRNVVEKSSKTHSSNTHCDSRQRCLGVFLNSKFLNSLTAHLFIK